MKQIISELYKLIKEHRAAVEGYAVWAAKKQKSFDDRIITREHMLNELQAYREEHFPGFKGRVFDLLDRLEPAIEATIQKTREAAAAVHLTADVVAELELLGTIGGLTTEDLNTYAYKHKDKYLALRKILDIAKAREIPYFLPPELRHLADPVETITKLGKELRDIIGYYENPDITRDKPIHPASQWQYDMSTEGHLERLDWMRDNL